MATVELDPSDQTSQLCLLDSVGEVVKELTIPTTRSAMERRFGEFARTRVVLETGTHAHWVHDVLVSMGHEAVVANARKVRGISASERKSDVRDARILARLGRLDGKLPEPVAVRAEDVRLDLTLVRARAAAVEARTQLVNAVRGLAMAAGHRLEKCSTACLHKQDLHASLELALRGLLALIEQTSKTIDDFDDKIEALARQKHPQSKRLTQISGVGDLTAVTFLLTLGDIRRFKTARDVGPYLGPAPGRDPSGGRDPQLRNTKCGDGHAARAVRTSHSLRASAGHGSQAVRLEARRTRGQGREETRGRGDGAQARGADVRDAAHRRGVRTALQQRWGRGSLTQVRRAPPPRPTSQLPRAEDPTRIRPTVRTAPPPGPGHCATGSRFERFQQIAAPGWTDTNVQRLGLPGPSRLRREAWRTEPRTRSSPSPA